jgi:hypothetical protein
MSGDGGDMVLVWWYGIIVLHALDNIDVTYVNDTE